MSARNEQADNHTREYDVEHVFPPLQPSAAGDVPSAAVQAADGHCTTSVWLVQPTLTQELLHGHVSLHPVPMVCRSRHDELQHVHIVSELDFQLQLLRYGM